MKLNTDKCHLLICGNKIEQICAKVGNEKIWGSNPMKLLGITIDKLKFNEHIYIYIYMWNGAVHKRSIMMLLMLHRFFV